MASSTPTNRRSQALATIAFGLALLAGATLPAQDGGGAPYGVAPWQAQQAVKDFVQGWVNQQVLTNDYSTVRVKISNLTRVYNPDTGWIVVAQFEGAVVPDTYTEDQEQPYFFGVLRISADADGVVQEAVVNEGQGLMQGTITSAFLHGELPKVEDAGDWTDWGGEPDLAPDPGPPLTQPGQGMPAAGEAEGSGPFGGGPVVVGGTVSTAPPDGYAPPPPPPDPSPAENELARLAEQVKVAQTRCNQTQDPRDCEEYQRLYQEWAARLRGE